MFNPTFFKHLGWKHWIDMIRILLERLLIQLEFVNILKYINNNLLPSLDCWCEKKLDWMQTVCSDQNYQSKTTSNALDWKFAFWIYVHYTTLGFSIGILSVTMKLWQLFEKSYSTKSCRIDLIDHAALFANYHVFDPSCYNT